MKIFIAPVLLATLAIGFPTDTEASYRHRSGQEINHAPVVVTQDESVTRDIVTDKDITIEGRMRGDCTSLGGPIVVKGEVDGNVSSMGGPVQIAGKVDGDVSSFGGPVEIRGIVTGDVSSLGGNVVLKDSATVEGSISVIGGQLIKESGVTLKGEVDETDIKALRKILPGVFRNKNNIDWRAPVIAGGAVGIGLLVLGSMLVASLVVLVLPALLFPKNVETAAKAIEDNFWMSAGVGTLVVICTIPVLFCLLISLLGIPLIPLALLLLLCAGLLGLSAFCVVLSDRTHERIQRASPTTLLGKVFAGYIVLALLFVLAKILPLVGGILGLAGLIIVTLGMALGLGAAFTTRMGTRNSPAAFSPKPQPAPAPQAQASPIQPAVVPVQPAVPAQPPAQTEKEQTPPQQ